uniref:DDE_Tnp_1_7 domain-containing protein n=1 Tax=Heterorhabditis bacteriophora TaxID=37862 RepID=A0A1I7X5M3_HETBA
MGQVKPSDAKANRYLSGTSGKQSCRGKRQLDKCYSQPNGSNGVPDKITILITDFVMKEQLTVFQPKHRAHDAYKI